MALRPNVVLFITHDTGRFISPYGVKTVHTPNCERLAREAVLFENAFCSTPLCSPSRASCVTGLHPHQHGVQGLTAPQLGGWDIKPDVPHAARIFRDAGYDSVLCGFEHETPHWDRVGFSRAISGPGGWYNGGGDLRNHAREMDAYFASRDPGVPFYMQIGCHETHHDWTKFETPPDDSLGLTIPARLRDDLPDVRREVAEFQGAVRRLDNCLGEILDVLDRRGLAENTIFVFTTDHGIDFPNYKGSLNDGGLETFLMMRYPAGGWVGDSRVPSMVSNIDILPTLLEACGITPTSPLEGQSLTPILRGDTCEVRDELFAGKTYHDTYDPSRAVRTPTHKYIRHFEVNIFQDLRLATETRRHYLREPWLRRSHEELYDLRTDPLERDNLAGKPEHDAVLCEMRGRLLRFMRRTRDPLLEGPVSSPHYAKLLGEFRESST